jgi:flagellar export protein FliJ
MKRFKFSLQVVLEARTVKEEGLKRELGVLRAKEAEEKNKLAKVIRDRQELLVWHLDQRKAAKLEQAIEAAVETRLVAFEISKEQLLVSIYQLEQACLAKMNEVVEASKERKAVEKLQERHHKEYLLEVSKEEQAFLDELANHQFMHGTQGMTA